MSQFSRRSNTSATSKTTSLDQETTSVFIRSLVLAFRKEDGHALAEVFSKPIVNPLLNTTLSSILSEFPTLPKEIRPIIDAFITLNKTLLNTGDQVVIYGCYATLLQTWNKYAEGLENWVMAPLAAVAERLVKCAVRVDDIKSAKASRSLHFESNMSTNGVEEENYLTKAGRLLDVSKRLCLTDRNEDQSASKRVYIYFFAGLQFKIYHKLQNIPLAKNLEKVLASKARELPSVRDIPKAHAIQYLYYSGVIKVGEGDYAVAWEKFKLAYELCHQNFGKKQRELILIYLIPLTFIMKKKLPSQETLGRHKVIDVIYGDLIQSLKVGDLRKFDKFFSEWELFFLKRNLYIAVESLRQFVLLRLIKSVYLIQNSHPHMNINIITKAIEFSSLGEIRSKINDNDETECLLANLIYKGAVRGYISHSNEVLVLSKKEAFPKVLGK